MLRIRRKMGQILEIVLRQPLRAKAKISPTSPYTGEALVRCKTER